MKLREIQTLLNLSLRSAGCCFMQDLTEKDYSAIKQHKSKKKEIISDSDRILAGTRT